MRIHLYFSERRIALKHLRRTIRGRHWQLSFNLFNIWMISLITRSPIDHVAIGYGGCVLSPSIAGNYYYPEISFATGFPGLVVAYELPCDRPISIDIGGYGVRKQAWPTYLKVLTFGLWRTEDCVCIARRILAAAGHPVPRYITAPCQLERWLKERGFKHESFRPHTDNVPAQRAAGAVGRPD